MEMVRTFGKTPDYWWQIWKKRSDYFDEDAMLQPISGFTRETAKSDDLQAQLQDICALLDPEEIPAFGKMLQGMLRFEPSEMTSVDEVVRLLPSA